MASFCALRVGGIQKRRTAKRNASAAPIHRMMMVMLPATVCAMCVGHPFRRWLHVFSHAMQVKQGKKGNAGVGCQVSRKGVLRLEFPLRPVERCENKGSFDSFGSRLTSLKMTVRWWAVFA